MTPEGRTLNISTPTAIDGPRFIARHLTDEQVAEHFARLARYGHRRHAAERGQDWQAVA